MQNTTTENEILSENVHKLIIEKMKNMNIKSGLLTKDQFETIGQVLVEGNEEHKFSVYVTSRKSSKPSNINWFDWGIMLNGKKLSQPVFQIRDASTLKYNVEYPGSKISILCINKEKDEYVIYKLLQKVGEELANADQVTKGKDNKVCWNIS